MYALVALRWVGDDPAMHALIALAAMVVSSEPPAPAEAPRQGIRIEARNEGEGGLVSLLGDRTSPCEVYPGHPCFLPSEPGRQMFFVDGTRVEVAVHVGESAFRIVRIPHILAWIGLACLIVGPPVVLVTAVAGLAAIGRGDSEVGVLYDLLIAAVIVSALGLPMIIVDALLPHTLLVPIEPAKPTALRVQLAPLIAPGRAALGVLTTF